MTNLLSVRDLTVHYPGQLQPALQGFDMDLRRGQCVAVVGPSGCGKSTLCRALLDLMPEGSHFSGSIRWEGQEVVNDPKRWHRLRGWGMGLVVQDHRHALDPMRRVGDQVAEVLAIHRPDLRGQSLRAKARALLAEVSLPDPGTLAQRYPHELSGGQRQRVSLAASLAADPQILLADEPTTALDLMVQRDIMALLVDLVQRRGLGLLLVTHDTELVPLIAQHTIELGVGDSREPAPAAISMPKVTEQPSMPCLEVRGLTVDVGGAHDRRVAVHHVDLDVSVGQTLGLVGESGCGKTTLARAVAGWIPMKTGRVHVAGTEGNTVAARRRAVQLVSQDAAAALNPSQTVIAAVSEAARAAGHSHSDALDLARKLLREVDLESRIEGARSRHLSGGQRQRVQVARALAASPRVLIADEPVSSLDPWHREQLLQLLRGVQQRHGLALILISHDLALVERWCSQVAVMLSGSMVELYRPGDVDCPRHPFARDLAAANPASLSSLQDVGPSSVGEPETIQQPPVDGCPYSHRCGLMEPTCRTQRPDLVDLGEGHFLRCPVTDRYTQ